MIDTNSVCLNGHQSTLSHNGTLCCDNNGCIYARGSDPRYYELASLVASADADILEKLGLFTKEQLEAKQLEAYKKGHIDGQLSKQATQSS